jgi:hypothetical protein
MASCFETHLRATKTVDAAWIARAAMLLSMRQREPIYNPSSFRAFPPAMAAMVAASKASVAATWPIGS